MKVNLSLKAKLVSVAVVSSLTVFLLGAMSIYENQKVIADQQSWEEIEQSKIKELESLTKQFQLIEAQSAKELSGKFEVFEKNLKNFESEGLIENEKIHSRIENTRQRNWFSTAAMMGGSFIIVLFLLWFSWVMSHRLSLRLMEATVGVGESSGTVGATISQVSSASQDVMSAVQQQAAAIQQTSSALEEITSMVARSAERSTEVEAFSTRSKQSAERGKMIVDRLIHSMIEIKNSNENSAQDLKASNEKVSQIMKLIEHVSEKTRVINDIVFQTKLLSFNASVEAARAGEHGKGFAVVAEEVGNLARMSGQAAQEINALLDSSLSQVSQIITENRNRVEKMVSTSTELLREGVAVTQECQEALSEILKSSADVSAMVSEITVGSHESAKGVTEVSAAIQEIESSSQLTTRAANVCESSSRSLSGQAARLRAVASILSNTVQGKAWINRFEWKADYLLDVERMDSEHQVLVEKINALAGALDASERDRMIRCFQDLASYTIEHFSHEENFMKEIKYPDLSAHQKIHAKLLESVTRFGKSLEDGNADTEALMNFLNDWLLKHILGADMKYARYSRGERSRSGVSLGRAA